MEKALRNLTDHFILGKLQENDILIITGDHGNDPADHSTDHTREFVPLLAVKGSGISGVNLGIRESFSDVAATVLASFGLETELFGTSFWNEL